jgi:hypothetical protein
VEDALSGAVVVLFVRQQHKPRLRSQALERCAGPPGTMSANQWALLLHTWRNTANQFGNGLPGLIDSWPRLVACKARVALPANRRSLCIGYVPVFWSSAPCSSRMGLPILLALANGDMAMYVSAASQNVRSSPWNPNGVSVLCFERHFYELL